MPVIAALTALQDLNLAWTSVDSQGTSPLHSLLPSIALQIVLRLVCFHRTQQLIVSPSLMWCGKLSDFASAMAFFKFWVVLSPVLQRIIIRKQHSTAQHGTASAWSHSSNYFCWCRVALHMLYKSATLEKKKKRKEKKRKQEKKRKEKKRTEKKTLHLLASISWEAKYVPGCPTEKGKTLQQNCNSCVHGMCRTATPDRAQTADLPRSSLHQHQWLRCL